MEASAPEIAVSYLNSIITVILAVAGWLIIYKNGTRLAKRNEAHSLFQITRSLVTDIYCEAEKAWSTGKSKLNEKDEHKLATLCAELEQCISHLDNYYDTKVNSINILKLRQALTRDDKRENSLRLVEIKSLSSDISAKLLTGIYSHLA